MRLFICGGGSKEQTTIANKKFNEVLNDDKRPLLYIPFAMTKYSLESCYEWIKQELKDVNISSIEMVENVESLENKEFNDYCGIYIGGGNTYLLLSLLKSNSSFQKLKDYALNNGIIFGGSAGAVICGYNIDTIKLMDSNEVNLADTYGLNLLHNISVYPHYTNKKVEFEQKATEHLLNFETSVFALPEEITLYFENGKCEVLGEKEFYIFESNERIEFNNLTNNRKEHFKNLKTDKDLMDFMNKNITYGWIDKDDKIHFNNLCDFRNNYKIASINKIIETGVGTCIEQAKLIKYFFDSIGLETKLFCHIAYENEDNIINEVKMHCIVLFNYNDVWYYFEHASIRKRGIHKCDSIDKSLSEITSGFESNDVRILTEIPEIPDDLSFKQFNDYVNTFLEYKLSKKKAK